MDCYGSLSLALWGDVGAEIWLEHPIPVVLCPALGLDWLRCHRRVTPVRPAPSLGWSMLSGWEKHKEKPWEEEKGELAPAQMLAGGCLPPERGTGC